jgi:uncharacterized protein (TIGR00730 family)
MATAIPARQIAKRAEDLLHTLMRNGSPAPGRETELVGQLIATCIKLLRDNASVGDIKILNTALKELRYAFKVFSQYRHARKVSAFGSARTQTNDAEYQLARNFAREIAKANFMVITGAGGGIMRACQEGAGRAHSFGVNIRLPFEQQANEFIERDTKLMTFKYFFTRKILFIKEAHAVVLFPGGFGTLDEAYEALTLVQTGKTEPMPIVFLDVPGGTYWKAWRGYVEDHLLRRDLVSGEDLTLFRVTDNVDEAVRELTTFYRVYHSMRSVGHRTVLRLTQPIGEDLLARLNADFADILRSGWITQQGHALPAEADEHEITHLPRLIMDFNRTNYGRLRQLIDAINRDG